MWTNKEELELIKSIRNKVSIDEIAKKHNRDINSIELRLQKIIYENITENNKDIKSISNALNLSEEDILRRYKLYKNFIENKKDDKKEDILSMDNIEKKIQKLERENKFIKLILENNELHKKLNEQIEKGQVEKNIKNIIKEMRKQDS